MTDLLKQGELEPIGTVAERVLGDRPSRPTLWRWLRRGVAGGIKLEAVHALNGWRTTEAAFMNFLERRSEAMLQPRNPDLIPEADDDTLRETGLL